MAALRDIVEASAAVASTASRREKIERLAELLRRIPPAEAATAAAWLTGELPQGTIGVGPAAIRAALEEPPAHDASLGVRDVDQAFSELVGIRGAGSVRARGEILRQLFRRATEEEQAFLAKLMWGELRQGALAGVMADAVARAAGVPVAAVRRAAQYAGDLPAVVRAALEGGAPALADFGITLFRPVQPMLAQAAEDADAAMARLHHAALDYKLDGARVQVHRRGDEVRVYSRRLNDVTAAVPELVEQALALPVSEVILDGEVIAMRDSGRPAPFQVTMSRFGSRVDVHRLREQVPLSTYFFDCLLVDGESLMDAETARRMHVMSDVLPSDIVVPRLVTGDAGAARAFLKQARAAGHEGLVAKALDASYDAGSRGGAWLKIKQADTLDLVVLAAEWGSGRRRGWLSNLHLGARDEESGAFVMLGKTFKGLTDEMLEWQTKALLDREVGREGNVVHVRPELVVEIAFEGVQTSRRYPAGMALRFARVRRYRTDKSAAEADTLARVRQHHVT